MGAPFQNPTKRQHLLRKWCSPHRKMSPIKIAPENPRIMGHSCTAHQLSLGTAACRERIYLGTTHLCKGKAAQPMHTGFGVKYKLILFIWTRPEAAVGYNEIVMERNAQPELLSHKTELSQQFISYFFWNWRGGGRDEYLLQYELDHSAGVSQMHGNKTSCKALLMFIM